MVFDLTRKTKNPNEPTIRKYMALAGVRGFPTILLLDSQGRAYARTGYQQGGAEGYVQHLDKLQKEAKAKRDLELKKADAAADKAAKAKALDEALGSLAKQGLSLGYQGEAQQIVELDAENKAGLKLKYTAWLLGYYSSIGDAEKTKAQEEALKKLDPKDEQGYLAGYLGAQVMSKAEEAYQAQDFAKGAAILKEHEKAHKVTRDAGKFYFYLSAGLLRSGDKEGALAAAKKGLELEPNSPLTRQLQGIIRQAGGGGN